jgi:hypothetical protein
MVTEQEREQAAKQHKQDNARLYVTLAGMIVILAIALFMLGRGDRFQKAADQANRDGIACILAHLGEHRIDDDPHTVPPPPDGPLRDACERFFDLSRQ